MNSNLRYLAASRVDTPVGDLHDVVVLSPSEEQLGTLSGVLVDPHERRLCYFIVESGQADSKHAEQVLRRDLADIVQLGADTLVLGCTHYPLLKPAIDRVHPGAFQLIDSATTTADKVERHLDHSRLRGGGGQPRHEVLATSVPEQFDQVAANLFGEAIEAQEVRIWEASKT